MERFFISIERRAFRMAQLATGNTDDALDIVQDAMLALVNRYSHKPESEWKPLFYRILGNRIRDWYRRQKVRRRWQVWLSPSTAKKTTGNADPVESLPDEVGRNPAQELAVGDSIDALDVAIKKLPRRQQQAFLLRAWEGMSVRETALAMKCSDGSVKTHYSRAIRALRKQLEGHWP